MAHMKWNLFSKQDDSDLHKSQIQPSRKSFFWLIFASTVLLSGTAVAQGVDISGICNLVDILKQIAKATAVLAVILFAINSMFGKSSLFAEIITSVVMALVVIAAASMIIARVMPGGVGC